MVQEYPVFSDALSFPVEAQRFETVMDAIKAVRARRAEMNVPPSRKAHLMIVTHEKDAFDAGRSYIMKLAYANEISVLDDIPADADRDKVVAAVTDNARMFMPMADLVDMEKERARLEKEIMNAEKQLQGQIMKLANQNFVTRAPEAVVNAEREKQAKLEALIENLKLNLSHLG